MRIPGTRKMCDMCHLFCLIKDYVLTITLILCFWIELQHFVMWQVYDTWQNALAQ